MVDKLKKEKLTTLTKHHEETEALNKQLNALKQTNYELTKAKQELLDEN